MTYFKFNNKFYKQKFVLSMGNPLSDVLPDLIIESLELGSFKYWLPINATYFRYIDNVLIFLHQNIEIENIPQSVRIGSHF